MENLANQAISDTNKSILAYCKFVTPNEIGITGGHQSGFLIGRGSYKILFDEPGIRGGNKSREDITIKWQNNFETTSRFIYYGSATRNEYRITRFGRDFGLLTADSLGSLFILCKENDQYYRAYILSSDEDIDTYLSNYGMLPTDANRLINTRDQRADTENDLMPALNGSFPSTKELSYLAQTAYIKRFSNWSNAALDPDSTILDLIGTEYTLFKRVENQLYQKHISSPIASVEELVSIANEILNRRKSRAGKSLENHLEKIFELNKLQYSAQQKTEGNKKPDFIMPGIEEYRDLNFDFRGLTFLGVKTTCKDRWRQVLNEADRIPNKHLFTLQPGISSSQIKEMTDEKLTLVIPKQNFSHFDIRDHPKLMSLESFITNVKANQ